MRSGHVAQVASNFVDLHLVMPKDIDLKLAHDVCDQTEVEI